VLLIDGGTVRLPRLIGMSRAMDLILTGRDSCGECVSVAGRRVDAKEALQIGLANRVVPEGCARSAGEELAASPAQFPQVTNCLSCDASIHRPSGVVEV